MFRAAQFYGLLPVPGVYQPVVAAQDRFEKAGVWLLYTFDAADEKEKGGNGGCRCQ